jgi:dolichol-phosphate mannosyltransferase
MISIIIPTKNEPYIQELVDNINNVIRQDHEIIIVDKSSAVPKVKGASVYEQKSNGLGNAVLEGLGHSKGEIIVMMDGDGSHDPADLEKMLERIPEYDIAIGSKLVKGGRTEDDLSRRVVSRFIDAFTRTALGLKQKDPSTGFMAIKRSVIQKISLKPKGFKLVMEVLYKSKAFNAKVAEVPITFHKRKAGESTVGWNMRGVKEFFRIINLVIDLRLGR